MPLDPKLGEATTLRYFRSAQFLYVSSLNKAAGHKQGMQFRLPLCLLLSA